MPDRNPLDPGRERRKAGGTAVSAREPLVRALSAIESRTDEALSVGELARTALMSASHLQRLFRLATGQPLMSYARGRRLARSLEDLLDSRTRIIEIAHRHGFGHEQSYIRAFRKEFGCTPGFARERRPVLPVRERIEPESLAAVGAGVLSGPQLAIVPSFHIVGRSQVLPSFDEERDAALPNEIANTFVAADLPHVPHLALPPTYIGLTTEGAHPGADVEYLASAQVSRIADVPEGLEARTLPTSHCVVFRYVGEHVVTDITMTTARSLYQSIDAFFAVQTRYRVAGNWFFERIDSSRQDGSFCLMEWLRPVTPP